MADFKKNVIPDSDPGSRTLCIVIKNETLKRVQGDLTSVLIKKIPH